MPLYLAAWPDGSCSLTEAPSEAAAAAAFERLGPVWMAVLRQLPEAPPGAGLLLHFTQTPEGLALDPAPGDRGVAGPDGRPLPCQDASWLRQALPPAPPARLAWWPPGGSRR